MLHLILTEYLKVQSKIIFYNTFLKYRLPLLIIRRMAFLVTSEFVWEIVSEDLGVL